MLKFILILFFYVSQGLFLARGKGEVGRGGKGESHACVRKGSSLRAASGSVFFFGQ